MKSDKTTTIGTAIATMKIVLLKDLIKVWSPKSLV